MNDKMLPVYKIKTLTVKELIHFCLFRAMVCRLFIFIFGWALWEICQWCSCFCFVFAVLQWEQEEHLPIWRTKVTWSISQISLSEYGL